MVSKFWDAETSGHVWRRLTELGAQTGAELRDPLLSSAFIGPQNITDFCAV